MKFESVQEAIVALRERRPFDWSYYERSAEVVVKAGLHCRGEQVYSDLDDALGDWRAEYECDVRQMAEHIMELGGNVDDAVVDGLFVWAEAAR